MDDVRLSFEADAIDFVVEKAIEFKLGARGLRSICEAILTDAMFEIPSAKEKVKTFSVSRAYAEKQLTKSKLAALRVA